MSKVCLALRELVIHENNYEVNSSHETGHGGYSTKHVLLVTKTDSDWSFLCDGWLWWCRYRCSSMLQQVLGYAQRYNRQRLRLSQSGLYSKCSIVSTSWSYGMLSAHANTYLCKYQLHVTNWSQPSKSRRRSIFFHPYSYIHLRQSANFQAEI